MFDSIEKVDSDYSTAESREFYAEQDAQDDAAQAHEDSVQAVLTGIKKLAGGITPADLDQLLMTMAHACDLPTRLLIEQCASEVECLV